MPRYAIITDTDASLPTELANQYHIRQVPITVHFDAEVLRTGIDIDDAALFTRIDREGRLPTTSAPSPGAFTEAYQSAFDEGYDGILCFTVSGEVSATYNAALSARDLFPNGDITVIDSRTLTIAQGFMVLTAAEAAQKDLPKEEIISLASSVRDRTHLFAALSTLKYLAMSGRVGHLAAGMANLLSLKPILTIRNGKLEMLEKVRTQSKAWLRAIELAGQAASDRVIERMSVVHVNAPQAAHDFEQLLRSSLACPSTITIAELTPGLSVHSGAGMVGVVLVVQ